MMIIILKTKTGSQDERKRGFFKPGLAFTGGAIVSGLRQVFLGLLPDQATAGIVAIDPFLRRKKAEEADLDKRWNSQLEFPFHVAARARVAEVCVQPIHETFIVIAILQSAGEMTLWKALIERWSVA